MILDDDSGREIFVLKYMNERTPCCFTLKSDTFHTLHTLASHMSITFPPPFPHLFFLLFFSGADMRLPGTLPGAARDLRDGAAAA